MATDAAVGKFVTQALPIQPPGAPTLVLGEIASVDWPNYLVGVFLHGADTVDEVVASFMPGGYVPRVGEDVWVWVKPGLTPIVWGMASERLFGSPTRGKLPAVRLYRDTTETIPNDVDTPVTWSEAVLDTDNMWTAGAPTRITFQRPGIYAIGGCYGWPGGGTTDARRITSIERNGVVAGSGGHLARTENRYIAAGTPIMTQTVVSIFNFAAGDYITLNVYQGGTSGLGSTFAVNLYPVFWAHWLTVHP
jgi:hypothetical protein